MLMLLLVWPLSTVAAEPAEVDMAHWSFEPMQKVTPPAVKQQAWVRDDLDRFILSRLEAENMPPAAEADRRMVIRRAYFDLIGLPPTFEQVEAFVADQADNAYEKVIDELLASPHYGERWGRHWLDIARFADTRGYLVAGQNQNYPYAYTYRDYVINAFNNDTPYDQFIREQLAADQLVLGEQKEALAAMGFLTVGRRFLNKQDEIIDDRIDVVSRGLMGLTVYCSRCHDHKYDPIPTSEYYSMFSIFDNSEEPKEYPLIRAPEDSEGYRRYKVELDKRKQAIEDHVDASWQAMSKGVRKDVGNYLEAVMRKQVPEQFAGKPVAEYEKKGTLRRKMTERWERFLRREQVRKDPLWMMLSALKDKKGEAFKPAYDALQSKLNPALKARMDQSPPNNFADVLVIYTRFFRELADLPEEKMHPDQKAIHVWLGSGDSPALIKRDDARSFFHRKENDAYKKLVAKVTAWNTESPDAPPRAMVLNDRASQHDNHVFVRGKRGNNGPKVARQFLAVASPAKPEPYTKGSGRLELAESILREDNPFTWRVVVNRIWQHHFGEGLVRTSSDFGTRGELPSHPELLDYLAQEFLREGKSFKQMHRRIMLSATYRMSSVNTHVRGDADPDNRLLSRQNRTRLQMEPMRDAMLAVSGRLDRTVGGRSVKNVLDPQANRRTLYGHVNRQDVPGFYRNFDFANPDATTGNRPETTVPQQALFAMNSPFVRAQVSTLNHHVHTIADPTARVAKIYQRVLGRNPSAEEVSLAMGFIDPASQESWIRFAQVLLMSNEFLFVD